MKEAGQVALFRFPHTDLEGGKLRPALPIAKLPGQYDDWLVCMASSQIRRAVSGFDEVVRETDADYAGSGLKTASVFRLGRLASIEGILLAGAIGRISHDRLTCIRTRLADWILHP